MGLPEADQLAILDGRLMRAAEALIPVTDDGLLRGDGVFEVLRVYEGRPFALGDHLERLERSAHNLRLPLPVQATTLGEEAVQLLAASPGFDGGLRIVLTRGGHRILLTELLPPIPETASVTYVTYAPTRILDGVKSLSYAANMLAGRLARERGYDEALLVTPHGRILEAPTASLFYVDSDDRLCTPPLDDHILASITRRAVIDLTGAVERPVTSDELPRVREAFLASTTREVQGVSRIEDAVLDAPGARTREAAGLLREHIESLLG